MPGSRPTPPSGPGFQGVRILRIRRPPHSPTVSRSVSADRPTAGMPGIPAAAMMIMEFTQWRTPQAGSAWNRPVRSGLAPVTGSHPLSGRRRMEYGHDAAGFSVPA